MGSTSRPKSFTWFDPFEEHAMNKSLVLASIVAALALAACGKKEEAPAPAVETPAAAPAPVAEAASAVVDAASDAAAATANAASEAAAAVAEAASAAASK
jgi:hypothetical protein